MAITHSQISLQSNIVRTPCLCERSKKLFGYNEERNISITKRPKFNTPTGDSNSMTPASPR